MLADLSPTASAVMGSYAYLFVNDIVIATSKNEPDPSILIVFRETDRIINPPDLLSAAAVEDWLVENDPDGEANSGEMQYPEAFEYMYVARVSVVRDRLEVVGVTLEAAAEHFEEARHEELATLEDFQSRFGETFHPPALEVVRDLSFDGWLGALREVFERGLHRQEWSEEELDRYPPLLRYMLGKRTERLGFPSYDSRFFLRAVLEVCDPDTVITYDLRDLAGGGYVSPEENLTEWAHQHIADDFSLTQKIVVLTEGSTDKWILEQSLQLLHPHLAEYFSFMDFEGTNLPGGAGQLVATVKAFVGAGIANRVIALFDNDTAAQTAMRALSSISLPNNVRVLRYPDIELARQYPTLGPTGVFIMDVNGLAGSVELYLGEEILRGADGEWIPVQWRGYDDGLKQYQGEIKDKGQMLNRFREKVRLCRSEPNRTEDFDWSGIRSILDQMRTAFH